MKAINEYRLQYWLYAILAKNYRKQVKMERSRLHGRYAVNRHDFNVSGVAAKNVKEMLSEYLKSLGFKIDENGLRSLVRERETNGVKITEVISLMEQSGYKETILNINSFVYKKRG